MIRLTILAALVATPALADPCKAIPDRGPMPAYLAKGRTFSGPVTYVGDGDSMCVDVQVMLVQRGAAGRAGGAGATWVEVRVADFYAPELHAAGGREAKTALERIAKDKQVVCTAGRRTYDRVVGTCRIGGRTIGDLMRAAGVTEGGNGR